MNRQTKTLKATLIKSKGSGTDGTFALSTETTDRDGDVIRVDGWDLEAFKSNPVALWQHDKRNPIGVWENVRVEGKQLIADLKLASTNLAKMARQLIKDGVIRAVSVGFRPTDIEPLDKANPMAGYDIKAAELLEASLVSVPANPEALLLSKEFGLTEEQRATIFADYAGPESLDKTVDRALMDRVERIFGKPAAKTHEPTPEPEGRTMNLSERIEAKRKEITALRDELAVATEKYAEEATEENETTVQAFADKIDETERQLKTFEAAEQKLFAASSPAAQSQPGAPGIVRSVKNYGQGELVFRHAAAQFMSHIHKRPIDEIVKQHYPDDQGLSEMVKAASAPADTATTAWAAALIEEQVEGFVDLLANNSVYGAMRGRGLSLNFTGTNSIKIPARTDTNTLAGDFVGEGEPIPVKQGSFSSQSVAPKKMKIISTMTEDMIEATTGQIEAIVRQAIIDDTTKVLDTRLLDNVAASTVRPAGLLNGVTPTASAGATVANIITDLKALLDTFTNDDAMKNLLIVLNPKRLIGLSTVQNAVGEMAFRDEVAQGRLMGIPLITSSNCATDEVHCVNAGEFATGYGEPRFAVSNTATLHMEDTSPEAIGTTGTPNVVAAPVRSLFQTETLGIRMVLPVSWTMRRSSNVSSLSGVAW